jgi:spermidine/putrescine transport system ATP-binding protein
MADAPIDGTSPAVELRAVSKHFGSYRAVHQVDLRIERGEFFSLLGPSGCGKTTTLRLVAGFELPDKNGGKVEILGEDCGSRRPYERPLSMVFQSYALFPHLTVRGNVAFGLQQRRVPKPEIPQKVERALDLVRLDGKRFGDRRPIELSGGQRQRVALARALVMDAPLLLLDEPLGALDLQLRKQMQLELRDLNKRLGTTFIYVTHDQEEALTMSDRIAVMANARVAQVGTPQEIYEHPRTPFVAKFIGVASLLQGEPAGENGDMLRLQGPAGTFQVPRRGVSVTPGVLMQVALRPERVRLCAPGLVDPNDNQLAGRVLGVVYRGEALHIRVELKDGTEVVASVPNVSRARSPIEWTANDPVAVCWSADDGTLLQPDPV